MSSKLILPNGQSHRSTKRGSDFITVDEVRALVISAYGPLASLVKEIAIKLQMDGIEPTPVDQSMMPPSGDIE